jgi:hypothetical protein
VGTRAGLDRCGKSRPTGIRSPERPARSSVALSTELPGPHTFTLYSCLPSSQTHFIIIIHKRFALCNRTLLLKTSDKTFVSTPCSSVLRNVFGSKGRKQEDNGENSMMGSFVMCDAEQILYG